jgi:hypothetical protein
MFPVKAGARVGTKEINARHKHVSPVADLWTEFQMCGISCSLVIAIKSEDK